MARDWTPYLPFLPLAYVAWADGVLSPSELERIRNFLNDDAQSWVSDEIRTEVLTWSDPNNPPSAVTLAEWLHTIRQAAQGLGRDERRSLTRLGIAMARTGAHARIPTENANALISLEDALGVRGDEAVRDLLSTDRRPSEPVRHPPTQAEVEALTHWLQASGQEVRRRLGRLLRDPRFRLPVAPETNAYRELVADWCRELADRGYSKSLYPTAFGGTDRPEDSLPIFETLAFHDLSLLTKFGVQFGLFAGSIYYLGTQHHHETFLGRAIRMELPGCFAMTELGHGSNVMELETTATWDPTEACFVVHTPSPTARKEYIGNAAVHGRMATVFAQLHIGDHAHGVHAFLVPIREACGAPCVGITLTDCGEKIGLNGVDNGRIEFDQVRVPRENLLDRYGHVSAEGHYESHIASPSRRFFAMLSTLVAGRTGVAMAATSVAKTGLTIAIRYGDRRRQFGPRDRPETPLLDYRTHQKRLIPWLARTYAMHAATRHLAQRYIDRSDDDLREVEHLAAALKARSTWNTVQLLQTCREACGGQGYMAENRIGQLKADSDIFTTYEGDNTILLQLVAKGLLSDLKQQLGDMKFFGLLGFLLEQTRSALSELNPLVAGDTDPKHLRDPSFHADLLRRREDHLLNRLAQRMRHRMSNGMDTFDAFVECQVHAVTLGHAHCDRVIQNAFSRAVADAKPEALPILRPMLELYGLVRIEEDRAFFLEREAFLPEKSKAIQREVSRLCLELRPHAQTLVEAFAIPPESVSAPIAL